MIIYNDTLSIFIDYGLGQEYYNAYGDNLTQNTKDTYFLFVMRFSQEQKNGQEGEDIKDLGIVHSSLSLLTEMSFI